MKLLTFKKEAFASLVEKLVFHFFISFNLSVLIKNIYVIIYMLAVS